jgi:hypothetical protein
MHHEIITALSSVVEAIQKRFPDVQIAGKGQNETLGIVNPLKEARTANNDVQLHVPENGGT